MITYKEKTIDKELTEILIDLSRKWESEDISYGYIANNAEEFIGKRIFTAEDNEKVIGYLFGQKESNNSMSSVIGNDKNRFRIDEFYICSHYRNMGIGKKLFEYAESRLEEYDYITLGTSTKNYKAILHFYIDELGMTFHSATLFKKIKT